MRTFFYILFSISTISFGLQTSWSQNQVSPISETHQIYLDKSIPLEKRIAEIDFKWNWIVATPSEDSIAKAQGWYVYMGAQRDQLKADLVSVKIEQLENYYQDILDLFGAQQEILTTKVSDMEQNRIQLAPNYPLVNEYIPSTIENMDALSKWIVNHPQQYLDFTAYLEKLVLNNF